jgi:glucokinase
MTEPVVIAVDVGGTKILVGTIDSAGQIQQSQRYPMDRSSQETTLRSVDTAIEDFMNTAPSPIQACAMGIGVVGFTDPKRGMWTRAINVPIHTPVPMVVRYGERYHLPVAIDNDVHAATLAELRWGAGREFDDFVYLNIGTGLAAGIVCNGQLVRGATNYAGELGHMVVEPDGDLCQCGRRGCLEPIASGGGILAQVASSLPVTPGSLLQVSADAGHLTAGTVFKAAVAGDALAGRLVHRAVCGLGIALVNVINLLNPAAIVYGGGVLGDGWLMAQVGAYIEEKALFPGIQIVPSPLDVNLVGLLGAASLAWSCCDH